MQARAACLDRSLIGDARSFLLLCARAAHHFDEILEPARGCARCRHDCKRSSKVAALPSDSGTYAWMGDFRFAIPFLSKY